MGSSPEKMEKTLHVGGAEIVKAMADLPSTKHDVAGSPEKFCIDAWPMSHGDGTALFITIHGQFTERTSIVLAHDFQLVELTSHVIVIISSDGRYTIV